ncbi:MAG: hypothetical protein M9904_02235 [Chitinophagaceae bacterium]|nr:hypothetical protein [Chitinophagaceae bacterium]
MQIQEVTNESFYCLFAPDGTWQPMTLSPDFPMCVAIIRMMHKRGMSESFHELVKVRGFKILPIKISFVQDGDENKPFK